MRPSSPSPYPNIEAISLSTRYLTVRHLSSVDIKIWLREWAAALASREPTRRSIVHILITFVAARLAQQAHFCAPILGKAPDHAIWQSETIHPWRRPPVKSKFCVPGCVSAKDGSQSRHLRSSTGAVNQLFVAAVVSATASPY